MYQNYYSSSDVQLYFSSLDDRQIIKVDTALSLGYSLRQTSTPIYSLGSRHIQYFSHGNTIGNGTLTIAFTDEEYLKYCLDYVTIASGDASIIYQTALDNSNSNISNSIKEVEQTATGQYTSNRLTGNQAFIGKSQVSAYKIAEDKRIISIGAIKSLFNIKMFLNNETATRGSDAKVITLESIKIIGENFNTSTTTDAPIMLSYNFVFKDIKRG